MSDYQVKDIGLASMQFFSMLIAVMMSMLLVSREVDSRTVFNIISKPVARWQFIVGKYLGLVSVVAANLLFIAAVLVALRRFSVFRDRIGAVVVALLISAVIIWTQGGNPIDAYAHIARSSLGSIGVLSDTLVKATPLIFTGLACSVAFRMRLWNIGAEGQLMMGAWGASAEPNDD